ncbi:MAG: T9SS type A sorting domain-containing protein, partial [Lentimicrobiaceae bacterium]|nr:T9SS type A sorting domain-containing protein [Lentimicrobiaceae bacterium]
VPYDNSYQGCYAHNNGATTPCLDSQLFEVTLRDLTFRDSLYWLEGPYCVVEDISDPFGHPIPALADPDSFQYTRAKREFKAVMAYYHVDLAARRILELGYDIPDTCELKQLRVDPEGKNEDKSSFDFVYNCIKLGVFNGIPSGAEDADVIWHEYAHAIQRNFGSKVKYIFKDGEIPIMVAQRAVEEGCSDYWATSYKRSLYPNYWDTLFLWNGSGREDHVRVIGQNKVYPTDYSFDTNDIQTPYDNSLILSSALMKIWEDLGRDTTDMLFLEMHYIWGKTPTLLFAAAAFMQADIHLYEGVHLCQIYERFREHGLADSSVFSRTLSEDTLISTPTTIMGTLVIDSGVVLTINTTVYCAPNTKIIVKPTAKLIIDGGTLTSACDGYLWEGIVVMGDDNAPQIDSLQGVVELKNGAEIRDAVCGIRVESGGIIYAEDDAHFINNKQSVYFSPYINYSNGVIYFNRSYFKNCVFEINQPLSPMGYQETMVELQGVNGIKFTNCKFLSNMLLVPEPSLSIAPIGIYANNSNIIIGESSVTFMQGSGCEFSRLYYAIWLQNSNALSIYASNFNNNHIGIMAVGSNRLTVENSQFDVFSQVFSFTVGIYLMGTPFYRIENNNFAELGLQPLGSGKGTAIITYNTGAVNNFIKNNSFNNLCTACLAIGDNGNGTTDENSQGLVYQCNNFMYNGGTDMAIEENSSIRFIQSGEKSPWATGNVFLQTNFSNITNKGSAFTYLYWVDNASHNPYNWQGKVNRLSVREFHCSSIGYGGEDYYTTLPEEYLVSLNSSYITAAGIYDTKKDDNDDDIIVIDWNSPTVQAIVEQLEMTVTGNDFIITINGELPVTDLEKQIVLYYELTNLKQYMDNICYTALDLLASDTAGLDMAQYRTWIGRFNTIESEYLLIETYISLGEFEEAEEILEAMPAKFSELDLESYENYWDYFQVAQEIYALDLEEDEEFPSHLITELVRLSSNDDFVAIKAYSLGEMVVVNWSDYYSYTFAVHSACVCSYDNSSSIMQNGSEYNNTLDIKGQDNQNAKTADDPLNIPQSAEKKGEITVKPNPTTGKLHITCAETLHATSVQIFDVVGKQYSVGAKYVLPNEEIEIDISHLANGLYFLKVNGKVFKVVKQ